MHDGLSIRGGEGQLGKITLEQNVRFVSLLVKCPQDPGSDFSPCTGVCTRGRPTTWWVARCRCLTKLRALAALNRQAGTQRGHGGSDCPEDAHIGAQQVG